MARNGSDANSRRRRRRESDPPWRRRVFWVSVAALVVLLLPIPWIHVVDDLTPGTAWRLDGRLELNGRPVDPPGQWSWLVVGRPQLVAEALWDAVIGTDAPARDLRGGPVTRRPALSEPAAAAVGLRQAGRDVPLGIVIEARDPVLEGYPEAILIVSIDGMPLTDRQAWDKVSRGWQAESGLRATGSVLADPEVADRYTTTFTAPDGRRFTSPKPGLPYRVVNTLDTAPLGLEAGISFKLARRLPVDWFRNLSLGGSHGAMVALLTYADVAGHDLAQGRHIAGTGGIRGDGMITPIAGLPAKARAARRAGADVLLFPAAQAHELLDQDLGAMTLVPVRTLSDAIDWLAQPVA